MKVGAAVFVLCILIFFAVNMVEVGAMYQIEKCDVRCYDRCMKQMEDATVALCKSMCKEACTRNNLRVS